jgi:hypothetical protein
VRTSALYTLPEANSRSTTPRWRSLRLFQSSAPDGLRGATLGAVLLAAPMLLALGVIAAAVDIACDEACDGVEADCDEALLAVGTGEAVRLPRTGDLSPKQRHV